MILCMTSLHKNIWYHAWHHNIYDIIHDIIDKSRSLHKWYHIWYHTLAWYHPNTTSYIILFLILDIISYINMHFPYFLCPAAADPPPAQRADETDNDRKVTPTQTWQTDGFWRVAWLCWWRPSHRHGHGARRRDSNAGFEAHKPDPGQHHAASGSTHAL
jgi:hypothetical protein